jgi:mRNA interferase MazF
MPRPGDLHWLVPDAATRAAPPIAHPYVVIRVDGESIVACALTTNLARVNLPGNVLLDAGEGGLPRPSVVEVAKVVTVAAAQLGDRIGALTAARMGQILAGMRFVRSYLPDDR